jgi:hypothetical protein
LWIDQNRDDQRGRGTDVFAAIGVDATPIVSMCSPADDNVSSGAASTFH